MFFPDYFQNPLSQSYWRRQKQRIIWQLKSIAEDKDYSEEIAKIDGITINQMKIKDFMGNKNAEIDYDKQFEKNCIVLSPYINQPVKSLSCKEYFNLIKFVDSKTKKK